jgi:hypothetical protein
MPQVGLETTIAVFERAKAVHTLDCAATVIGTFHNTAKTSSVTLTSVIRPYSVLNSIRVCRKIQHGHICCMRVIHIWLEQSNKNLAAYTTVCFLPLIKPISEYCNSTMLLLYSYQNDDLWRCFSETAVSWAVSPTHLQHAPHAQLYRSIIVVSPAREQARSGISNEIILPSATYKSISTNITCAL